MVVARQSKGCLKIRTRCLINFYESLAILEVINLCLLKHTLMMN